LALLSATDCKAILTPEGYNLQEGLLDKSTIPLFRVAELLELLAEGEVRQYKFSKSFDEAKDDPLMVLHTSGSTGLPKPIVLSHAWLASMDSQNALRPLNGHASAYSALTAKGIFCSLPPFHVCNPSSYMRLNMGGAYIKIGFWSSNRSIYAFVVRP
jgi:acyl-CoA synthetase (AMP-forming)/AMP-acid ligase II